MKMNYQGNAILHKSRSVERRIINPFMPETSILELSHQFEKQDVCNQTTMNLQDPK